MKTLQKIQGLVATYRDAASTRNEQDASYNLVCKLLAKEFKSDWATNFCVFDCLVEGSCYFGVSMTKQNPYACNNVQTILKRLGIKFNVVEYVEKTQGAEHICRDIILC